MLFLLCECMQFLPRDVIHSAVVVVVLLSVRRSVRLSVTLVHCAHMVQLTIMISSPYGIRGPILTATNHDGHNP